MVFSTTADGASGVSESFRVTSTGALVSTGRTAAFATPVTFSTIIPQILAQSTTAAGLASVRHSNDTASAFIFFGKSRSGTFGGQTVVVSGDQLGTLDFRGSDGTAMIQAASIVGASDGTPGANDMPGRLVFLTTLDGATTALERMRVRNDGQVVLTANGATFAAPPTASGQLVDFVIQGGLATQAALDRYVADANSADINFRKSRNATIGSHTIVNASDVLGSLFFWGSNGTTFDTAASIAAIIDGTPGASADMPGALVFYTTPNASATLAERLRINNTGYVTGTSFRQAVKAADTSRNTTTTLTADPDLTLSSVPAGRYAVEIYLEITSASDTPGFKWTLAQNGSDWFVSGVGKDAANAVTSAFADDSAASYSFADVNPNYDIVYQGALNMTSVGTVSVNWAQLVSDATNVTLGSTSYLKLRLLS
jgi:hypothetical protein